MTDLHELLRSGLAGRYEIERELGRGGMATVYLATDLKLERQVALKVLRPELGAALGADRFLREIQIASRLNHPHILALHDSGEASGHLYYAMPYVAGESLRQRLEREGQLPIPEVIAIVRAIASALTYAHRQGIVHRDIKPENILLSTSGAVPAPHPLVADFGIARALDKAAGDRLTETGLALGTPAYMSPEQAAAGSRLDGRSDIYALGCVAYEMLAGAPPFTGPTAQSILARHAVDPVPPLHTVRTTIPIAMEGAIEQALAKVPADRFNRADEFADALTAERAPRRRFQRSDRWTKPVVAIAALTAVVATAATMLNRSAPPPVTSSATKMAVLPLVTNSSDTGLVRLGRDLAVTLAATLNGIGGIETADRLSIGSATVGRHSLSAAEQASVARRLGAGSFLRGTVVGEGEKVRLDLGLYATNGLAPLAEGLTVTGYRDSIGALTDSTAWAVLRQVWQHGDPPSPSLAGVTTRSLPALRAFLEGERELDANEWEKAGLAFRSAVAADSSFGLAAFRYTLTRWWIQEPVEPEILQRLRDKQEIFSERERLLLEAFLTSERTPRLRMEKYRVAAQRYPEYWPTWFLYADALFHAGPVVGYHWSEAMAAFRRVVTLNPNLVPAWEHIFHLTLGRDSAETSAAYRRLRELGWPPPQPLGMRLITRLEFGIGQAGGVIPKDLSVLADSVAANMVSTRPPEDVRMEGAPLGQLMLGFPAAQIDLNRRALRLGTAPARMVPALRAANAWAWAARGRWDSALTILSDVAAEHPGSIWGGRPLVAVESYGLAVIASWLGAVAPSLADQRRPQAAAAIGQLADSNDRREQQSRLAWFDGIIAFTRHDRRALASARAQASRTGYHQADLVGRSLGAFASALAGDFKSASRELVQLEEYCLTHESCNSFTPYTGVQRVAAAEWLRKTGDLETADRLLLWGDAPSGGWMWTLGDAIVAPAYLLRGEIAEARGANMRAREYYQQFLRRYDQPMPPQVHLLDEAKAALGRLQRD